VFSDGREKEVEVAQNKLKARFSLDKSGTYGFKLRAKDGIFSPAATISHS